MTGIIEQINAISVTNTYKLHDLLDRVLSIQSGIFPDSEIKLDQERIAFVSQIDDYTAIVQRDMNTFNIVARIVKDGDIVAECVASVDGEFNEKYARMYGETKLKVSTWFTEIGNIDVTTLQDGTESDKAEAVEESASDENDVVEVVSSSDND